MGLIKGASPASGLTLTEADLQAIADRVWDHVVEDPNYQARHLMRLFSAVLAGTVDKVGNLTPEFRSLNGDTLRLKMSTDDIGNRPKRISINVS